MLLAVEIGNTNTTFGLFAASGELTTAYRLSTDASVCRTSGSRCWPRSSPPMDTNSPRSTA